jgi:hypothetical protein
MLSKGLGPASITPTVDRLIATIRSPIGAV